MYEKLGKIKNKEMVDLLNGDLANEYKHMHFYLHSHSVVEGLHRNDLRNMLLAEANNELLHVQQFSDKIVALGGIPSSNVSDYPTNLTKETDILNYIVEMEQEVVDNYVQRLEQVAAMEDKASSIDLQTFLEDQIRDSKGDLDNVKKMIANL